MELGRGQIWWTDFGEPIGSGPGYRRPALIVQLDRLNRSRLATVIVVPLTSITKWANAPGNVLIPAGEAGLAEDSVANLSLLTSIDRRLLDEFAGFVPMRLRMAVDDGLRLILDIECPAGTLQ
jgi:mRNA interferase MazF